MKCNIYLRPVKEQDMELLLEWRNDEECRKNFFSSDIVDFDTHKAWFKKMLVNKNEYAYILIDNNIPIGQVRLSVNGTNANISYSIAKEYRGKGYGVDILRLVTEKAFNEMPNITLVGEVFDTNIASQQVFEKLGFEKQKIVIYKKKL